MASTSTVVTRGYGSFGSVYLLATRGYGIGTPSITSSPFYRPRAEPSSDTRIGAPQTSDSRLGASRSADARIGAPNDQMR